jgi:Phospholipase_D-nuclease N-terminal
MFRLNPTIDIITIVAILVPLAMVVIASVVDLLRRGDLSIGRKVLWALLIIFTVYVGVAIYVITRPTRQPDGKRYGATVPRASAVVDALETLHDERRVMDPATYLERKRRLLGLSVPV